VQVDLKVLFAFLPSHIPYAAGIALLSALCRARGIKTELNVLTTLPEFAGFLRENRFDYICFSVITHLDAPMVRPFIDYAGVSGQNVLVGGTWARWFDSPFLTCRGEGETLPDFLMHGDDRLFNEDLVHEDLNDLPLPDYELFKNHPFDRGYGIFNGFQLPYYASRGCPFQCSFCLNILQPGGFRVRTKMEEDLTELRDRYHPDLFFIGDAMAPYISKKWLTSWGEFRHPFFAYIRADIQRDTLLWLIDRGMNSCAFGVESGDEQYRNEVLKKNLSDEQIFSTVELLKKHHVRYVPFYMQGTPGETFELKAKTYKMKDEVGGYPFLTDYQELV
jgi:radical SAM superfamily enzyme YgiQ (UPF0313 family)